MKFFWVNLGATFNEVNQGGFLWAPLYGFYPISTDGLKRPENFKSCRATLRRIRGL